MITIMADWRIGIGPLDLQVAWLLIHAAENEIEKRGPGSNIEEEVGKYLMSWKGNNWGWKGTQGQWCHGRKKNKWKDENPENWRIIFYWFGIVLPHSWNQQFVEIYFYMFFCFCFVLIFDFQFLPETSWVGICFCQQILSDWNRGRRSPFCCSTCNINHVNNKSTTNLSTTTTMSTTTMSATNM